MKLFALALLLVSANSLAGYECHISIAHTDDLDTVISEKTFFYNDNQMKTSMHQDFLVEVQKEKSKTSIDLKMFSVGWSGEEEFSVSAFRSTQKKSINNLEAISNKVSLQGDDKDTLWFDSYKMDLECKVI